MFASVAKSRCNFMNSQPIASPMPTPPISIHPKLSTASIHMNWPVATANIANRKIINEDASLSKLSPSRMDVTRRGTFTNLRIALALTASGGETMPPNKNPIANDMPGRNILAAIATDVAVKNTTIKAKLEMIRRYFQSSFHEIAKAASYNKGGRKIRKMSSGFMCNTGIPGIKLINRPAITSTTG